MESYENIDLLFIYVAAFALIGTGVCLKYLKIFIIGG